jgi:hypothetical protein
VACLQGRQQLVQGGTKNQGLLVRRDLLEDFAVNGAHEFLLLHGIILERLVEFSNGCVDVHPEADVITRKIRGLYVRRLFRLCALLENRQAALETETGNHDLPPLLSLTSA